MEMTEAMQRAVMRYQEMCPKDTFAVLLPRHAKITGTKMEETPYTCLKAEEAESVQADWNRFHQGIQYRTFREFYFKYQFCCSERIRELGEEKFLDLIADRCFLFLDYNQHRNDGTFPSVQEACLHPHWYDSEKVDLVLKQGFFPTNTHKEDCETWKKKRKVLEEALKRRRDHLRRYGVSSEEPPRLHVEPFRVKIQEPQTSHGLAKKLSILFHAYLKETVEYAYQSDYAPYVGDDPMAWVRETGSILEYLTQSNPQADQALVFYHLFTSQALKLAKHHLRVYQFGQPKEAKKARLPMENVQGTVSRRIICNIKLYDHLLSLFQPADEKYAKFCFYAFTGFQWYTHFTVPEPQDEMPYQPSFQIQPNQEDGVDELGHLLRRNIFFCLSIDFTWLTPHVYNTPEWDARVLANLLLYDANIKAPAFRLTNRIQRFLEKGEGRKLLDQYAYLQEFPTKKTVSLLNDICKKNGFSFQREERMYEDGKPAEKKYLEYSRYVLEFQILEQLYAEGRRNLYQMAQKHFGNLFFFEDPFFLKDA